MRPGTRDKTELKIITYIYETIKYFLKIRNTMNIHLNSIVNIEIFVS